jgi:hypothetical protein
VGRDIHPVQPALEPRIEEARLPSEAGAGDAVEHGDVLVLVGAGALRRLLADLGIGISEPRLLLRIDHENVGLGNALDVDAGRRDQGQATQALRRAHRHLERDPAAERLPDNMHAGEPELLDGIEIEIGDVGNVVDPGRHLGCAETGVVGDDHVEALRQGVQDGRPFRQPVGAVQVQEWPARAAAREAELATVEIDRVPDECHRPPCVPVRRRGSVGEVGNRLKHFLANAAD